MGNDLHNPSSYKLICQVGPGTGCAPFRSLIQERGGSQDLLLFYGCRNKEEDYFFNEEWQGVDRLRVITAFSRDQEFKVKETPGPPSPNWAPQFQSSQICYFLCRTDFILSVKYCIQELRKRGQLYTFP